MGDANGLTTRREILKRGAIVGGGVLWVTPVVQTLGMGPAFATAVSSESCTMTTEVTWCTRSSSNESVRSISCSVRIPPCMCNPLPSGHKIILVTDDGEGRLSWGQIWPESTESDGTQFFRTGRLISGPSYVYARCIDAGTSVVAQGKPFHFTEKMYMCATSAGGPPTEVC